MCNLSIRTVSTKSKPKRTRKVEFNRRYTTETLLQAQNALNEGKSIRQVAAEYDVPKTTLHAKMNNYSPIECKMDPSSVLGQEVEQGIAEWIIDSAQGGFPVTKVQLLDYVQKFVLESEKNTPFTDGRPSKF